MGKMNFLHFKKSFIQSHGTKSGLGGGALLWYEVNSKAGDGLWPTPNWVEEAPNCIRLSDRSACLCVRRQDCEMHHGLRLAAPVK